MIVVPPTSFLTNLSPMSRDGKLGSLSFRELSDRRSECIDHNGNSSRTVLSGSTDASSIIPLVTSELWKSPYGMISGIGIGDGVIPASLDSTAICCS